MQSPDSLLYLPIAEATVITFLAPIVACWACSILLHEPFTRTEQIAGLVSLFGVVLIARPMSLFSGSPSPSPVASSSSNGVPATNITVPTDGSNIPNNVTPAQRLSAVGIAMIGVLGAACAYTTIRTIGKRAHPLISVTYFALWCTIVSTLSLLLIPSIAFQLPTSIRQWSYLFFLGACGFAMQFLLTAGLQHEKGSRATNMLYTQMLFALGLDKVLWGTTPGAWSLAGSSLILGSVVYVAVRSEGGKGGRKVVGGEEERGLVEGVDTEDEDEDEDEEYEVDRERVGGVQEVQLRNTRV
ncbi:MAG: hypothetical protein M1830_002043 [Pleopsidium flavum]|nr:MAG: hypothetical protein M1830_002043 [Pleopsidium flavum]